MAWWDPIGVTDVGTAFLTEPIRTVAETVDSLTGGGPAKSITPGYNLRKVKMNKYNLSRLRGSKYWSKDLEGGLFRKDLDTTGRHPWEIPASNQAGDYAGKGPIFSASGKDISKQAAQAFSILGKVAETDKAYADMVTELKKSGGGRQSTILGNPNTFLGTNMKPRGGSIG